MTEAVVRAAGGVPVRSVDGEVEVLLIHRARYGDWTFPKGKVEPGETDEACALREVEEETGLRCSLGPELPSTRYTDAKGRPKRVRYWQLGVLGGDLQPQEGEVDEVRWVSLLAARDLLTYGHDGALIDGLAASIAHEPSD
ncbi:MAG: NUDIX hydrolase [Actinobacteria bacterium]|nr:NUDIX hydrolase [Actinomycetota bacterium]